MPNWDHFVILAEMRTGSNFLEANLNAIDGLTCHGEAFNPGFIGYPNRDDLLGVTRDDRDADPTRVIAAIRAAKPGLHGFRYFSDHDARMRDPILTDRRCAKIVLTRNPVESYVSRKIAAATGQWKLTNAKHARSEQVRFSGAEFERHLERLQSFQVEILNTLQRTGQTAFYVDYEDLQDVEVMNGLAAWLGVPGRLDALDRKLKKQNPEPMQEKVANFDEMEQALARLDRFNLNRTPNFEPRRGAAVPTYLAAARTPLLYMPVRGGPEDAVIQWLAALDGAPAVAGFNWKSIRSWRDDRPGHRSFTVLRHPLSRAHAAFCDHVLPTGPGAFNDLRNNLIRTFGLPVPGQMPRGVAEPGWTDADHAAAFRVFLTFLKANLGGQTALRTDPSWASQTNVLQGLCQSVPPDMILREDRLAADLAILAWQVGRDDAPEVAEVTDRHAARLAAIHTPDLEAAAREAYARDYGNFGFADWTAG